MDDHEKVLTLDQIQCLTGHESKDAVRMALRRGGVKSIGVAVSATWPPKKIYDGTDVWRLFSDRMIEHSASDPAAKELFWKAYGDKIQRAASYDRAKELFTDRLGGESA